MIAKGTPHNNGVKLAQYIITGKDGERAELWKLEGFASPDIKQAFRSIHVMAEATKCEQPFFHVQVRNREGETLTRQQWETTAQRIMRINGLTGQPYAIAFHVEKLTGEEHMHLAVSLIDAETMTAKRLPFYALRLKRISRELETEFGLEPVRNDREGPIKYAATKTEQRQAQRLGVDKDAIRNSIRHCWDQSDNGRSFQAALEDEGLILAQGDRRDYVVIDHAGGLHGKFSRTLGATANQVREKLADLDPRELPTVDEAKAFVREVAQDHEHSPKPDKLDRLKDELAEIERQLSGPSPEDLKRQLAEIDRLISTAAKEKEPQRETDIPVLAVIRDMEQPPAREPDPEKLRKRELADLDQFIAAELLHLSEQDPIHFEKQWQQSRTIPGVVAALENLIADQQRRADDDRQRQLEDIDKFLAAEAERDYAQRDPARDEMAWHDAIAKAAIEKETIERQFVEPRTAPAEPARRETRAGGRDKRAARQPERTKQPAPELGKTQAEIRLARVLSPGPQSFANALEDRGFILSCVTDDDIQKDLEKLLKEWEERRRNPQSWMEHESGFAALPPEFQESARRSFEEWEARKQQQEQPRQRQDKQFTPDEYLTRVQKEWAETLRQRPAMDKNDSEEKERQKRLEDYVDFVQRKWAEGPKSQLERAAGGLAVVTPFGSVFTLGPRNTGLSREELPEYLKGINRAPLLSVTDAQAVMEDVKEHRRTEWQHQHEERLMRQPVGATAAGIRLAYALTQTGPEFAAAIEDRGFILTCTTEADAERLNRWERQRLREARAGQAPGEESKPPRKERDIESYNKYQAGELVIVNQYGSVFQITAATTGAHAAEREARLDQIDRAPLLSVTAAQGAMKKFQQHQREERQQAWQEKRAEAERAAQEKHWPTTPPQPERKSAALFAAAATEAARDDRTQDLTGTAATVWKLWTRVDHEKLCTRIDREKYAAALGLDKDVAFSFATDRRAFVAALDTSGIGFAIATKEEADRSHREAELAKAAGNYAPRFKEGEIVIVTAPRPEYRREGEIIEPRRVQKIDQSLAAKFVNALGTRSELKGIEATKQVLVERAKERAAEWEGIRLKNATSPRRGGRNRSGRVPAAPNLARASSRAMRGAFGALGKLADGFSLDGLTPKEKYEAAKRDHANEREADKNTDHAEHVASIAEVQKQEQQREAERKQERERYGGGRER